MSLLKSTLLKPRFLTRLCYSTQKLSEVEARKPTLEVDTEERRKVFQRPTSPHLSIYQPQLTWTLSALHRITGTGLALGFYGGAMVYALFPFSSMAFVSAVYALPSPLIALVKFLSGGFFSYHSLNGIRHLMWDTATGLTLKGVYNSGYAVLGGSLLLTSLMMFL